MNPVHDSSGLTVPCHGCDQPGPHDAHLAPGALDRLGAPPCTHPAGTECEHTRALQQWMRFGHGRLASARIASTWYDAPDVCPLCRSSLAALHIVKGTDRRVCSECIDDIPNEMNPAVPT